MVEGRGRQQPGSDFAQALSAQALLVLLAGLPCQFGLCGGGREDGGAILAADVIALAIALGGVMPFPEGLQQRHVGVGIRVMDDEHGLGVPGGTRTDLPIIRVCYMATGIAHGGAVNALLPVQAFRPPEAPHGKQGLFHARRPRGMQCVAGDVVQRHRSCWYRLDSRLKKPSVCRLSGKR